LVICRHDISPAANPFSEVYHFSIRPNQEIIQQNFCPDPLKDDDRFAELSLQMTVATVHFEDTPRRAETGETLMTRQLMIFLTAVSAAAACGCENNAAFMTPERMDAGLVVILPGIEGESGANRNIRDGLNSAGVDRSLQIWHWGRPVPGVGMILNQIDFFGNYLASKRIAQRIMEYQDKYPDRPVHIIGHSGGGGIAIFAASVLPDDRRITGVILLSASISSGYDITRALNNCSSGIVNFYNKNDVFLLGLATTVLGNVGGTHGPSAGLLGFNPPGESASEKKQIAYRKLYQVPLSGAMLAGATAHFATSQNGFVYEFVSPWVLSSDWPADPGVIARRMRAKGADVMVFTNAGLLDRKP